MIKQKINNLLGFFGYEIVNRNRSTSIFSHSMEGGIKRVSRFITPTTIVDIGAAAGTWTQKALTYWKDANFILIEPLEERKQEINALIQANTNLIKHILAVAGKEKGKIELTVSEDLDSSGVYGTGNLRTIDVVCLDDILKEEKPKFVLKLDTHRFEIPIFEGAGQILKNTDLIIVETYGFYLTNSSKVFWEMCQYLDEKGFRLFDIVDLTYRPKDLAFWQCDAFFLPKNHSVFSDNNFA
jgi:FkbM family methyltransferase